MPATALDRATALIVIDLQRGLAEYPTVHPFAGVVANAARLAAHFRAAKLPVVLVRVAPSADLGDWLQTRTERKTPAPSREGHADLVPELNQQPSDIVITKRGWSSFYGTELDLQLRRRKVTGVVLAGVATSIGVDSTARGAHERAYDVTVASDAVTDLYQDAHDFSMTRIFPRLGEVDTTEALLDLLARSPAGV